MRTQILKAPDISCDHCERTIKKALGTVPGVKMVGVDIPSREVRLTYDEGRVDRAALEAILAREGYPVSEEGASAEVKRGGSSCCGSWP